jgi:Wzt C-terminal domain
MGGGKTLMERKYRQVFLHFGGDKTGSTSIQSAFNASRKILLESGLVAYPPGRWHAQLGSFFSDSPERYIFNSARGIVDTDYLRKVDRQYFDELTRWIAEAPKCDALLFSYEGFVDLDENALRRFKSFCESVGDALTVVLYVRLPLSYAVSVMSQRVKFGILSWPAGFPPISPYRIFLEKMTSVFGKGNVRVRPFLQASLKNGNVVDDFLGLVGVPDDVAVKVSSSAVRTNRSLSWPALRFGEALIANFKRLNLAISIPQFQEKYGQYLELIPGESIRLTADQIEEILIAARPHSEYLEQEHGISFREDVEPYRTLHKEPAGLTDLMFSVGEAVAHIVTHDHSHRRPDFSAPEFLLLHARLNDSSSIERGQSLCFDIGFSLAADVGELEIGIHVYDEEGRQAFGTNTTLLQRPLRDVRRGTHQASYRLVADLPDGQYSAGLTFTEHHADNNRELARYNCLVPFRVSTSRLTPSVGYLSLPVEFDQQQTSNNVVGPMPGAKGGLDAEAALGDLILGESVDLPVRLHNASAQTWMSTKFNPIHLSYHWLDQTGNSVIFDGERTPLPVDEILSGQTLNARMHVVAPATVGHYRLVLMPVQENRFWFDALGFDPGEMELAVVAQDDVRRFPGADARLSSQVGRREGSGLVSGGQEGFLMFGPHARLAAGRYIARIEGQGEPPAAGAWMDVCLDKGRRTLSRQELSVGENQGWLLELPFELAASVSDLEVRLWVTAEAHVRVESLSIEPDKTHGTKLVPAESGESAETRPRSSNSSDWRRRMFEMLWY